MQKNPNFANILILLFLTMSIFSISYNYEEVYGIEYKESEWGIKLKIQDPWKLSSNSNNYNNLCDSNNKFKCLIVLDNALLDKLSSITILAEKGQDFKNKCKCNSLLEFVQYDYNRSYSTLKNSFLIGDNQTILNGNVSAWQIEYNIINKNNIMNHLITWTMVHDIFYKISYHAEEDIYSKYLPSVKEFINTIEFVIPKNDSQYLSKDNLPSFMIINNTKEEKKKQPSFMTTNETKLEEQKALQSQLETTDEQQQANQVNPNENALTEIGEKFGEVFMENKGLTKEEELVNETIALENEIINETIIGQQEKQEQIGGSPFEEQLKLVQEKLKQSGLGSLTDSDSKLKVDVGFPAVNFSKMLKDAQSSIEVEYQSAQLVILRGDEETLLVLNGTLAPFWYAIDIVKKHGYQLKEITEIGMVTPTRLYAILEKEKIEEKIQSLDKQTQSAREKIKNQTYQVEDTGNWIKDESDNLSFMYPSHWNVNISDSRFDNYELLFRDQASNSSIRVSDEAINPTEKVFIRTDPKEYVDFYMKYKLPLSSDAKKIDTYPKGKVSIAGLLAYSELYLDQGNAILISLAFPEGNERHYTVVSKSTSSNYDNLEPTMLEIIKSLTPKTMQKSLNQIEIPFNNTDSDDSRNNQETEQLKITDPIERESLLSNQTENNNNSNESLTIEQQQLSELTLYDDPKGKFTLEYDPSIWMATPNMNRSDGIQVTFADKETGGNEAGISLGFRKTPPLPFYLSIKEVTELLLPGFIGDNKNVDKQLEEGVECTKMTIQGYDTCSFIYSVPKSYSESYPRSYYMLINAKIGDKVWLATFVAPEDKFDDLEQSVIQMINSIKITPKTIQKPLDREIEIPSNNTDSGNNQDTAEELQTTTEDAKSIGEKITEDAKKLAEDIGEKLQDLEK